MELATRSRLAALAVILVLATGAAGVRHAAAGAGPAAGPAIPRSGHFAGLVDIGGGRRLYLECAGRGSPTVLLEAGLRTRGDIWSVSEVDGSSGLPVLPGVARFTRVCAYDRPGTTLGADERSRSDPVAMPRTARSVVADLHALLAAARIPGPYVLVGHSTGGLFVRLFASTYPRRIAGLVLVDTLSERMQPLLGPRRFRIYRRRVLTKPPAELAGYKGLEYINWKRGFRQLRRSAPLPRVPLTVLEKTEPFPLPAGLPGGFGPAVERAWRRAQDGLVGLLPHARHLRVHGSGHYIMVDRPRSVTRAIRRVVHLARARD